MFSVTSYDLKAYCILVKMIPIAEASSTDKGQMLIHVHYLITSRVMHNLNTTCHKLCSCKPLHQHHIVSGLSTSDAKEFQEVLHQGKEQPFPTLRG